MHSHAAQCSSASDICFLLVHVLVHMVKAARLCDPSMRQPRFVIRYRLNGLIWVDVLCPCSTRAKAKIVLAKIKEEFPGTHMQLCSVFLGQEKAHTHIAVAL